MLVIQQHALHALPEPDKKKIKKESRKPKQKQKQKPKPKPKRKQQPSCGESIAITLDEQEPFSVPRTRLEKLGCAIPSYVHTSWDIDTKQTCGVYIREFHRPWEILRAWLTTDQPLSADVLDFNGRHSNSSLSIPLLLVLDTFFDVPSASSDEVKGWAAWWSNKKKTATINLPTAAIELETVFHHIQWLAPNPVYMQVLHRTLDILYRQIGGDANGAMWRKLFRDHPPLAHAAARLNIQYSVSSMDELVSLLEKHASDSPAWRMFQHAIWSFSSDAYIDMPIRIRGLWLQEIVREFHLQTHGILNKDEIGSFELTGPLLLNCVFENPNYLVDALKLYGTGRFNALNHHPRVLRYTSTHEDDGDSDHDRIYVLCGQWNVVLHNIDKLHLTSYRTTAMQCVLEKGPYSMQMFLSWDCAQSWCSMIVLPPDALCATSCSVGMYKFFQHLGFEVDQKAWTHVPGAGERSETVNLPVGWSQQECQHYLSQILPEYSLETKKRHGKENKLMEKPHYEVLMKWRLFREDDKQKEEEHQEEVKMTSPTSAYMVALSRFHDLPWQRSGLIPGLNFAAGHFNGKWAPDYSSLILEYDPDHTVGDDGARKPFVRLQYNVFMKPKPWAVVESTLTDAVVLNRLLKVLLDTKAEEDKLPVILGVDEENLPDLELSRPHEEDIPTLAQIVAFIVGPCSRFHQGFFDSLEWIQWTPLHPEWSVKVIGENSIMIQSRDDIKKYVEFQVHGRTMDTVYFEMRILLTTADSKIFTIVDEMSKIPLDRFQEYALQSAPPLAIPFVHVHLSMGGFDFVQTSSTELGNQFLITHYASGAKAIWFCSNSGSWSRQYSAEHATTKQWSYCTLLQWRAALHESKQKNESKTYTLDAHSQNRYPDVHAIPILLDKLDKMTMDTTFLQWWCTAAQNLDLFQLQGMLILKDKIGATTVIFRTDSTSAMFSPDSKCRWSLTKSDLSHQNLFSAMDLLTMQFKKLRKAIPAIVGQGEDKSKSVDGEKDDVMQCKICYERQRQVAVRPCGHIFACEPCSKKLATCAICRQPIIDVIRVFFS